MTRTIQARRRTARLGSVVALLLVTGCSRHLAPTAPTSTGRDGTHTYASSVGDEVALMVVPGVSPEDVARDYGAGLARWAWEQCAALIPPKGETADQLVVRMTGDPRVRTVERNGNLESAESRQQSWAFDDGYGSYQTYVSQDAASVINLSLARTISTGRGVLVAVLDTGIETSHPALVSHIVDGYDFVNHDIDANDSADGVDDDGDGRVDEARGHGTHVAGLVELVAPEARLLAGRVLDSDGRGDMLSVASGIYWAMEKGARVINLSLGSLSQSDMVQAALEDAENAGVVCVAAAGNWGTEYPREFPARSSHVLAVAAVDEDRQPAPFSSYGTHIAVSAPGVALRSAYVGGGYVLWSGTSMSAPLVSGSAATLIALHPSWGKGEVRKRLSETSDPLHPDAGALAAKFGSGVVNAGSALYPDRDLAMNGGEGERVNPRRR